MSMMRETVFYMQGIIFHCTVYTAMMKAEREATSTITLQKKKHYMQTGITVQT